MKLLIAFSLIVMLFAACNRIESLIEVSLPTLNFSTPAVSAGTFSLVKEVSAGQIDSLRNGGTVSINSLSFSVLTPEELTLRGFTAAKLTVSGNGQSVTVFDQAVNPIGRNFSATTSADITQVLNAAQSGNGKVTFAMSVTTNVPTPAATWRISTTAALQ